MPQKHFNFGCCHGLIVGQHEDAIIECGIYLIVFSVLLCYIDKIVICAFFVIAPPVFIKTPPTIVEVLLGDSLTLSCGAHGNPRPTIVWHKDDSPIEKHEKIKVSWISRCHLQYFVKYFIISYFHRSVVSLIFL